MKALLGFIACIGLFFVGSYRLIMSSSKPLVVAESLDSDRALKETAKLIAEKPAEFQPSLAGVHLPKSEIQRDPAAVRTEPQENTMPQERLVGGFTNFEQFQQRVEQNAFVTFQDVKQVWASLGGSINQDRVNALEMTKRIGIQSNQDGSLVDVRKEVLQQLIEESSSFRSMESTEAIEYSGKALSAYLEIEKDPNAVKKMCEERAIPILNLDENPNPSP